jgi:protein disulfide-isomerase A6
MAPEYKKAADKLNIFKDQVLIAKVNCDDEKALGKRFKIGGYPTLLWFPKGSSNQESYNSGRDSQSIINWVEQKTGLRVPYKSVPAIRDYTQEDFESFLNDPKASGIVMFYAPCKIPSVNF